MMRVDQPLQLAPRLVPKPWGGRRLADLGRPLPPDGLWGESWDVSDLDPAATPLSDPASLVVGGPHDGRQLSELIAVARDDLLGKSSDVEGRFPLLVKLLDARQHLSVQVHPSRRYVAQDPSVNLKTESWVVVAAAPGAGMWLGLDHDVTQEELARAAGTPGMTELLRWVPAVPGEVHHLPAGLVHALGAGVVVAEVQTPSDTTFRLYDWTREYARQDRELHVAQALHAVALEWELNHDPGLHTCVRPRGGHDRLESESGVVSTTLVATDDYHIDRHVVAPGAGHVSAGGRARVVMVLAGTARIDDDDVGLVDNVDHAGTRSDGGSGDCEQAISTGGVMLLPAAWGGRITVAPGSAGPTDSSAVPREERPKDDNTTIMLEVTAW